MRDRNTLQTDTIEIKTYIGLQIQSCLLLYYYYFKAGRLNVNGL